jgi:hypothetical protein
LTLSRIVPNRGTQRGVSDTLAFVLTFSIIITSVGLVYGVGFTSLHDIRNDQQAVNAQQSFEAFSTDIDEIRDAGAHTRSSEMSLREGTLAIEDGPEITITINGSNDVYDESVGSLQYSTDQTTVGLEAGATFRKDRSSVMLASPRFQCGTDGTPTVISIVVIEPEDPSVTSIGSSGTVGITAQQSSTMLQFPNATSSPQDVNTVSVTMSDSDFQSAWEREFDDRSDWTKSGNTYTCTTDRVYVRVTVIDIEYET